MTAIRQFISDYLLYTKWKDNDKYPSLIYNNLALQKLSEILGISSFRVIFWNFIARHYYPFKGFYSNGENTSKEPKLDNLFLNGFTLEENFLPKELHETYSLIFQKAIDQFVESKDYNNSQMDQMRVNLDLSAYDMKPFENELAKLLNNLISKLFPTEINPSYRYELEISKNGNDHLSALSKWHIDRPCPSIKALFFPLGVNVAPFSYIQGSHLYDKKWKEVSKFFRNSKHYISSGKKNMMLKEDVFFQLSDQQKDQVKELNNLQPNTFYLGAHQGLHRKKPFDKPGYRFMVTIETTHSFSKLDLISGTMKSILQAFKKNKLIKH